MFSVHHLPPYYRGEGRSEWEAVLLGHVVAPLGVHGGDVLGVLDMGGECEHLAVAAGAEEIVSAVVEREMGSVGGGVTVGGQRLGDGVGQLGVGATQLAEVGGRAVGGARGKS